MVKRNDKVCALVLGIAAVLMFYLTWCLATISYRGNIFLMLHMPGTAVTIGLFLSAMHFYKRYLAGGFPCGETVVQLQVISVMVVLTFMSVLIWDIRNAVNKVWFVAADMAWCAAGICACILYGCDISGAFRKLADIVRQNRQFTVLLGVCLGLAIEPGRLQFKWDGALYEQACREMNLHSLSSLGAFGHLSQSYGMLYCLAYAVTGSVGPAMAVLNIVMYLGSTAAFYGIIRHVKPDMEQITAVLLTAVYAFSPYTLGMVNYYSLDYVMLCTGVMMIYFAFRRMWELHFISALLFCFTKEPAIVAYGFLCIGYVAVNWFTDCPKGTEPGIRIGTLLRHREYYMMLTAGVLWFVTYLLIGGWSGGDGGFAVSADYVLNKLKVLYLLNFSWALVLIAIGGTVSGIRKSGIAIRYVNRYIVLSFSLLGFTLISVLFNTVNHARYAGIAPVILSVAAVMSLTILFRGYRLNIMTALLAVLMLISSYATIDPVSLAVFEKIGIGSRTMITTGAPVSGDSMIYNKQMLGMENAMNDAIGYAMENDYQIFMPTYCNSTYAFDGMMISGGEADGCIRISQYWDTAAKARTAYENDHTILFETYQLLDRTDIPALGAVGSDRGKCYIYADFLGKEYAGEIEQCFHVNDRKEFAYRGWKIYLVAFDDKTGVAVLN